jgi:hypothetical protein
VITCSVIGLPEPVQSLKSPLQAEALSDVLSKRRAEALRREMEKPAEERTDAATFNEIMEG